MSPVRVPMFRVDGDGTSVCVREEVGEGVVGETGERRKHAPPGFRVDLLEQEWTFG